MNFIYIRANITHSSILKQQKDYIIQVHEITQLIPVGRVTTYGAIADYLALGSARMVGWALKNCNFLGLGGLVPAHRVVNAKGELSGRNSFPSPTLMQEMLAQEGVSVTKDKVDSFATVFWHPSQLDNI